VQLRAECGGQKERACAHQDRGPCASGIHVGLSLGDVKLKRNSSLANGRSRRALHVCEEDERADMKAA
jgi:hypothetical protein